MESRHILIIEDDPTLLRGLRDNFRFKGYRVSEAGDGRAGLEAALAAPPDLVLLDIMMPELNGFEVCKRLRAAGLDMPVIMLTAKGREEDIIRGLNAGAHDYVTKPFSIKELLARAENMLRRGRGALPDVFRFGDNEVNLVSHKLYRDGAEVPLTPKEFGLLTHFIKHLGRALTRDEIMNSVWGSDILVTPRSVDRCINTLRHKVEPEDGKPVYIQTIRDIGYRFEVPEDARPANGQKETVEPPAPAAWKIGRPVAGYRLTGRLAPRVWCGEDHAGGHALLHRLTWLQDKSARAHLQQIAQALHEAHAAPTFDTDLITEEDPAVWLERGDGRNTLADRLKGGPLAPAPALALITTLAKGLADLHKAGVYHLNIHAGVVHLEPRLRLSGFGLSQALLLQARASGRGVFSALGRQTPLGWSPGRLRGGDGTAGDDVFALGALFYEVLSGSHPFAAPHEADTVAAVLTSEPEDLTLRGVPKSIWRIIARCLRKDAHERFAQMGDLLFALEGVDL